jgi:DNA-binding YbaB/EbfC family protein
MPEEFSKILDRLQQLQEQMAHVQEDLGTKTVTMESGGGVVKVTANGKLEIVSIEIDKEIIDPKESEMLEDLVVAGVNRALERARELADSTMSDAARSLLPPGFPGT